MTMRVLVVDDDDAGRYLLSTLMRARGHDVLEAANGEEALRQARATAVDVVITDILMPRMDGYQLCREWKADPELSKAPLIFYSATYTDPADMHFADGLGADAFIVKPLEPDRLADRIEEVVRDHAAKGVQAREPSITEENEVLREYNERLVSKLEQKIVELNRANADITRALEVLSDEVEVKKTLIEQLTRDVEVRERAQRDLSATAEMLGAMISSAPVAVVAVDLDWTVRVWNPAAERLFGWAEGEALGRPYPPYAQDPAGFEHVYGSMLAGSVPSMEGTFTRTRKDGTTVEVAGYASALHGQDGAVTGIVTLFTDVSEQRHIEDVKAHFLSIVGHELRTPLTAIIGYADVLDQIDAASDPGRVHQVIDEIRAQGGRMRALVEDLLEVGQIQTEPMRLDLGPLDLAGLLRDVVSEVPADGTHVVVLETEKDLPPLTADAVRMRTVFAHLVANAVKYSPRGGDVRIGVRRDGDSVRVDVADHGVGIDPSDADHVFGSFTQADMSDRRSFGGIGLGLFLARQIVEAHRGRISVASTPGEGSTFTVVLPIA